MSPTPNQLAQKIGRDLRPGDILVKEYTLDGGMTLKRDYDEVIVSHVRGKRKKFLRLLGGEQADCVEVSILTPHGRLEKTRLFSRDSANFWNDIVKEENRTDKPSLRER